MMKKFLLILAVIPLLVLAACQGDQSPDQMPDQQQQEDEVYPSEGGASVEFDKVPSGPYVSGSTYEFSWRAVGGNAIRDSHVQASYSKDFSDVKQSLMSNNGPGLYKGSLDFNVDSETTVYLRAAATIDGDQAYSDVVTRAVQPSGSDTGTQTETETEGGTQDVQVVEMTARQFEFVPNPVTVKKGVPVRLEVTSTDVAHGIGISAFGVNKNLPAGETVVVEFTPDKTGEFNIVCTVFCGSGHGSMTGTLIVEE